MQRLEARPERTDTLRELLTAEERELLADLGPGVVSWARRVRLEQEALDQLLSGDDEPDNVLAFGRRSSAAWGQP